MLLHKDGTLGATAALRSPAWEWSAWEGVCPASRPPHQHVIILHGSQRFYGVQRCLVEPGCVLANGCSPHHGGIMMSCTSAWRSMKCACLARCVQRRRCSGVVQASGRVGACRMRGKIPLDIMLAIERRMVDTPDDRTQSFLQLTCERLDVAVVSAMPVAQGIPAYAGPPATQVATMTAPRRFELLAIVRGRRDYPWLCGVASHDGLSTRTYWRAAKYFGCARRMLASFVLQCSS